MPFTVDTLAERILTVVEKSGMTRRELAEAIGVDPTALSKALSGKRNFKPLEVALIAETLGVPVQYLLADDDEVSAPVFVAARAQPNSSPAVEAAMARTETMVELDKLLEELGLPAQPAHRVHRFPKFRPYEQGEWLADRLRSQLGLGIADLAPEVATLAASIESKFSIDVAIEPLPDGLDGLAVAHRPFGLIMVSSSIPATRQRYTMAHELGHLMAGDGHKIIDENVLLGKSPEESRANSFAAAFLMPAGALRAAFEGQSAVGEQLMADLLGRYRVSLDALAFRLHNVGLIDVTTREEVRRMSSARISLRQGRALDLQARNDRRWPGLLLDRAVEAYATGRISIRPLANLIGVDPDVLLQELAPPQFGPVEEARTEAAQDDDLVPRL
jgi:Zn-dependent peptidase ImmA (M78 family)/lambda repressor-like predicted transcriptional regulator